jgi:hypothetical protein
MKYNDIKKFTSFGRYHVNVSLVYLKEHLDLQMDRRVACLDMNPDFQRAHVWSSKQQIKFVEHLLKEGQSGQVIYSNCSGWQNRYEGPYVLVDGKQRLTACLKFLDNEIPVFGNNYYKDFDKIPRGIGLIWHVNDLKTRKEVLQWYLDLNSGGVVHTKEELEIVQNLLEKEK